MEASVHKAARRSPRIPRADRERQLLDIAEDLFARHGYEAISIEDVARQAGITRPVVYDHFGSKEGLYLACVRRARNEFERSLVQAVADDPDPQERLLRGADAFFAILERDPRRWAILFGVQAPLQGDFGAALTELRRVTVARIAELLAGFAHDVDPQRLDAYAHAVSGAGEQLGRWWLAHPEVPRAQVSAYLRDFAWQGLRPFAEAGATS
ncbi:MAG TPA: TetR/AcrR family transcriptional regulator [Solirubrobacteraceae bacterium]|jgi:AcrR family transcriptional regulator|nr:TetR/AcrR family transcriptional regulator [Solirubrobacteraceae bacterium]